VARRRRRRRPEQKRLIDRGPAGCAGGGLRRGGFVPEREKNLPSLP
jgi:hypothetical protein